MNKPLKILHVEDVDSDAELVELSLKKANVNFEKITVETSEAFRRSLIEFCPDIILSDHSLPSFNSHEALDIYHELGIKIPFILVTGTMSDEFAVDIIRRGADDYVLKDRLKRLPIAISSSLEKYRLIQEKEYSLDQLVRNEKRYRALIENNTDAVMILNAQGDPEYASPSTQRVLGYQETETLQLNIYDLLHPDDRDYVKSKMNDCIDEPGITIQVNAVRVKHKSGKWLWLESAITNLLHDTAINGIVDNFRDITERKMAEEKLVHANRLYAFISQINQTIIHVKDEHSVFKEACRIAIKVGKFKAAWIGMFDHEMRQVNIEYGFGIFLEDSMKFSSVPYEDKNSQYQVFNTKTPFVCNNIQKDDTIEWKHFAQARGYNSFMVSPIRKSGKIIGTFNVYSSEIDFFNINEMSLLEEATTDISFALDVFEKEKLKAMSEEALRKSEKDLQTIFDSTSEGFILMDLNGTIRSFNKKAEETILFNVEKKVDIGSSIYDYIHESRKNDYKGAIEKVVSGESLQYDHGYEWPNGEVRWFNFIILPVKSNDKVDAICITSTDITTRIQSQKLLKESQSNLKAVINNTDAHIYSLDTNFRYVIFNQSLHDAMRDIYGVEIAQGEIVFDFLEKIDPKEAVEWRKIYSEALAGKTIQFEKEFRVHNVSTYTSFSIYPIWENNIIIGLSCFARDITKQKEEEKYNKKITADLIQRNKDLEQFSYIVSHNLRAPVVNILGLTNLLIHKAVVNKEREKTERHLYTATSQLDDVIKDLNNVLVVQREINEKKEEVVFSKLVENIKSSIQNLIEKENVQINVDFASVNSMLTLKGHLYSIFYNLISNSIKYSQPGKGTVIDISSTKRSGKIILTFRDNGMGIDLEKYGDSVFGLYKRFHFEVEGKGMGLFMTKTQVETLGGRISVLSEVNKGTAFTIEFEEE